MLETNKFSVINIRRYLNSDNPKLGESRLLQVLSGFSCPKNPDVERFLEKSSIQFTNSNFAHADQAVCAKYEKKHRRREKRWH